MKPMKQLNNPVAKHTYTFNKPKVEPNKKKINIKEYFLDDEDDYSVEYVNPEGEVVFMVLTDVNDDNDVVNVRRVLMNNDCTFIKIFKNDVELL